MKKIIILILVTLSLYGCPLSLEPLDTFDGHYFTISTPTKFITIAPQKKEYRVGETIEIIYTIPNKIGQYATEEEDKKYIINRDLEGVYIQDFGIPIYTEPDYNVAKVIINGVELGKSDKKIEYIFDENADIYKCSAKITFLKPSNYYWGEISYVPGIALFPRNTAKYSINDGNSRTEYVISYEQKDKENPELAFKVIE